MTFLPGIRQGRASSGAVNVPFYDTGGSPDRPPIVLLHGTGGSAINNFWALFPMLAFRHRVIAFDFVDPHQDDVSVEHYVAQAVSVITELSPGVAPVVVGYSLGAVVAAKLAADHPDLVASLVLVAGWTKTDQQQRLRNELWMELHAQSRDVLANFMVLMAYSPRFLRSKTPDELCDLLAKTAAGPDRLVKMTLNRTVDISASVPQIAAPTLVVGCTEDQMAPIWHSELLYGGIRNARFASIASGHAVVHERPAELFTLIDDFATGPERTAAGTILSNDHA